ncbi:MAG TPA: IclR family transcriptional regulator [Phototrophicaceae bacterium]|nr:IclR family transcriptional regulator [Phototrophicaceae bacterium]
MQSNSVIDRLLDILLLYQEGKESWSIDDITQMLDIPKSTCYRLVRALQERGFLEKSGTSNYQLGVTFMRLSAVALSSNRDIRLMALPSMKRIADAVKESVSLMRLINHQVVCVENIEGQYSLRVTMQQGRVQPLHAGASSRVLLAYLPEENWAKYLDFPLRRYTDTTITDFDVLRENLREVRRAGYAISDGEIEVGPKAIAVPLMKNRNEVIAALSIEAPTTRVTDQVAEEYLDLLMREAAAIHQEYA